MTPALTLPPNAARLQELVTKPDARTNAMAELEQVLADDDEWLDKLEEVHDRAWEFADQDGDASAAVVSLWEAACDRMVSYQHLMASARQNAHGRFRREFVAAVTRRAERLADLMRTMAVVWPELELETPDDLIEAVWTIRIAPLAYLRAMWNLFWSAILHPRSETTIELKTGTPFSVRHPNGQRQNNTLRKTTGWVRIGAHFARMAAQNAGMDAQNPRIRAHRNSCEVI